MSPAQTPYLFGGGVFDAVVARCAWLFDDDAAADVVLFGVCALVPLGIASMFGIFCLFVSFQSPQLSSSSSVSAFFVGLCCCGTGVGAGGGCVLSASFCGSTYLVFVFVDCTPCGGGGGGGFGLTFAAGGTSCFSFSLDFSSLLAAATTARIACLSGAVFAAIACFSIMSFDFLMLMLLPVMLLVVYTESDLCRFCLSCAGFCCGKDFSGTDFSFSFDLDFAGCVGDMERILPCLLGALVVTAFAVWLLDFFFVYIGVFLAGGIESFFSDLILRGLSAGEVCAGEKSEELFCLFGLRGDLDGFLLLCFFDILGDLAVLLLLFFFFMAVLVGVLPRLFMLLLLLFLLFDGLLLLHARSSDVWDRLLGDLFVGDGLLLLDDLLAGDRLLLDRLLGDLFVGDGLLLLLDRLLGDLFAGDGPGLGVFGIGGLCLLDLDAFDAFEGASDFIGGTSGIIADACGGREFGAVPGAAS